MNTSKLREALIELQQQKTVIDNAISNLEKIISAMNGDLQSDDQVKLVSFGRVTGRLGRSFLDIAVSVLESHAKPIHIKELTYQIERFRKKQTKRNSVEATIARHIKSASDPRLVKVGPGFYALPSWPEETKDLWSKIVNK